ncbi:hypothetical protein KUTeg_024487 [Tegillarca granosa]|uniref:Metalloendopeptidase n=1 Tax=Tegillarca granosa TaxID=220873 RepID=A0ABQ9E2K6_TEGGR|nr:hypothetical protein KUTeg_024487 [Tegillarca granosa]
MHEFCHAIGMQHEQSRNDRDKHVKVHFDNIEAKNKYNLAKEKTMDKNPYDYFSIMQYELQSFTSKSWAKAMSFVDPDLEFLAGLSKELTFYDIMDITKAYQCNDHCQNNLRCINGGFVNHKCECFCPEGLSGKYCELINCDLMMLIFDTKTITGVEPSKGFRIKAQAYNVNPYVIVFEYNFDDDDVSLHGIKVESNTEDKWAIGEEQATYDHYGNYDQQDTYDQQYFYGHKIEQHETYDGYGPPFDTYDAEKNRYITTKTHGSNNPSGTTYCLSFHFRRHTQVEECAVLHIGDIKDRWSYSGCEKSGWKLFEGTYGPDDFDNYPVGHL